MTLPLKYDAACRAIAEAKTIDEVTSWIDKAAAVREYTRRIKNRQMEIDAIEIRVKAKRRRGELLLEFKQNGQLREGKKPKLSSADDSLPRFTLEDLGVSANESSEEQAIAKIDGTSFDRLVARCRAYAESHADKHSFNVLKPPPEGEINGSRAIMGSRQEPDDSLDYFPTPPWATRALVEIVLPQLGVKSPLGAVWEPACGEGHMAEALADYGNVLATDIGDYGYGQPRVDFLATPSPYPKFLPQTDWIITNPPFSANAEKFVLTALDRARVGVAMFFRLQWLETNGRYERIFQPFPPAMIAQFAERVPLHKGRWEPDGDTATAYLWIIWLAGRAAVIRTEFSWIPPGQREALERPGDRERFTTHPVTKAKRDGDGETLDHDPATGEIIDVPQFPLAGSPVVTDPQNAGAIVS